MSRGRREGVRRGRGHRHDHSYQRSKQLSHGPGCPSVPSGSVDADCIVEDGADGRYDRGAGPVVLITGTRGRRNYRIEPADPEAANFARARGAEGPGGSVYGYSTVTVSGSTLSASFASVAGAAYTDSFTIAAPK